MPFDCISPTTTMIFLPLRSARHGVANWLSMLPWRASACAFSAALSAASCCEKENPCAATGLVATASIKASRENAYREFMEGRFERGLSEGSRLFHCRRKIHPNGPLANIHPIVCPFANPNRCRVVNGYAIETLCEGAVCLAHQR